MGIKLSGYMSFSNSTIQMEIYTLSMFVSILQVLLIDGKILRILIRNTTYKCVIYSMDIKQRMSNRQSTKSK